MVIARNEGKVFNREFKVEPGFDREIEVKVDRKGFMGPMTMGYKVSPASLLKVLKAGDSVRFTIDTGEKAIVKLEKLKK